MRRGICLLTYEPGLRLNERDLGKAFGISRTPLRSDLKRLENEGFIQSQRGLGTIVTAMDLQSMHDIYVVRMHLMDAVANYTPLDMDDATLEGRPTAHRTVP